MKNTAALLALTFTMSTLTGWSQPAPGGRGDNSFRESESSPDLRRAPSNRRQPDAQDLRGPRGPWGPQREFAPGARGFARGGNRNFGPKAGPMRRGLGGPPMLNQRGPMARRNFAPPGRGRRGSALGGWGRYFGPPRIMGHPRQGRGGPGRGRFLPPMGRGQGGPEMRPGAGRMRGAFGGPPMMDQSRPGRRGQFLPPPVRRPGQPDRNSGIAPMRGGFGGQPMPNQREPMARRDFAPPDRGPSTSEPGSRGHGKSRSGSEDARLGSPRGRESNPGRAPQAPSTRDQN